MRLIAPRLHSLPGALAVFVLLLMLAAFAAACGGDGDDNDGGSDGESSNGESAAEPTPTQIPLPSSFEDFAPEIAQAVKDRNAEFFLERAETQTYTCTAEDVAAGQDGCSAEGDEFESVEVSYWGTESSGRIPVATARQMLLTLMSVQDSDGDDEYGETSASLYAVGSGRMGAAAVLSAALSGQGGSETDEVVYQRVVLVTEWQEIEGEWRMAGILNAFLDAEEFMNQDGEHGEWVQSWKRYGE